MGKVGEWARRVEIKHFLTLVGAGAVVAGTVRAFMDHNSTPMLIVGASLGFAALVADRLQTAEASAGDKKVALGFTAKQVVQSNEEAQEQVNELAEQLASSTGLSEEDRAKMEAITERLEESLARSLDGVDPCNSLHLSQKPPPNWSSQCAELPTRSPSQTAGASQPSSKRCRPLGLRSAARWW